MLRLIGIERGRCGVLRVYQHAKLDRLEIVTIPGKDGGADVIHIQHVKQLVGRKRLPRAKRKAKAL